VAGLDAPPERVAEIRARLGTDRPLYEQYVGWLGGLVVGDFGESLVSGRSVRAELASRLPITITLAIAAFVVSLAIALPLGVASGARPGGVVDRIGGVYSQLGIAIPSFWMGILLLLAFSVRLRWFPLFGAESVRHFVLPALALGIARSAVLTRIVRGSVTAEMARPYVAAARARGAGELRVVVAHALGNSLLPLITVAAVQLGYLLGGAVIVEQVFSIPGVGRYVLTAIYQRDLPVVQAAAIVGALCFSVASLVADVLAGITNPKLRASA